MARYADQKATRAAMEQADKHKTETARLKAAIREHHSQVHAHDWGADDQLWAAIGLEADVTIIG